MDSCEEESHSAGHHNPGSSMDESLATPESIRVCEDGSIDNPDNTVVDRKLSAEDLDKLTHLISKEAISGTKDQVHLEEVKQKLFVDASLANSITQSYAPLLPHENLTSPDTLEYSQITSPDTKAFQDKVLETRSAGAQEAATSDEWNDPTLDMFPSEPHQILERMATIYREVPEDDSIDDGLLTSNLSPRLSTRHSPEFSHEFWEHLPSPTDSKPENGKF